MPKLRELYENLKRLENEMVELQNAMNILDCEDDVCLARSVLQHEYEARRIMLNNRLNKDYEINPKSNTIKFIDEEQGGVK